ncbi:MAG TPA: hypothetical protein PK993_00190 [Clostridia bacterium]|nr:hypothetical protein [Clostridia bacterium]
MKNSSIFSELFKGHSKRENHFERNLYKMIFSNLLKKESEEVTGHIKRLAELKEELKSAKDAINPEFGLIFLMALSKSDLGINDDNKKNNDNKNNEKHMEIYYIAIKKYIANIEEEINSIKHNLCILILEEIRINNSKYLFEILRQKKYNRIELIKEYLKISEEIVESANKDCGILKKFF